MLTAPNTFPFNLSFLVKYGSISKPTPINPPETEYNSWFLSDPKDVIMVLIGVHITLPC